MTSQGMLALYGLVLITICFIALFVRYTSIRGKARSAERKSNEAYEAGFRAGFSRGLSESSNIQESD
jgi:NADH:ubiquinone oxidoreductase subunit 3 (subunit A)